ncbi:MAG: hypothetical protein COT00_01250 [Candidatus Omnitrophica bacterium CG07_land_8_20_14_0_80_50_8]|nr:MAG: hypothetical protein AUJ71_00355 [Candidatus Omnitrophica bacterium CG1_02_49_16]PIU40523.1 MAG: hypothetical protein COT00_01250 [Candidatus Omnitrophica bacterium CG07_land_8_20_14_0_80_50_8]
MIEEWLIDGYNLLHVAASSKNTKQGASREALFDLLASFASGGERKVAMVLDGVGDEREFDVYRTKFFEIIYSNALTADSVIEKILCERKGTVPFMVVTNDRAVTQVARGLGARVMRSEEFMTLIRSGKCENEQILFKEKVKSHGFNRPFEEKLRSPNDQTKK